jgi:hypothetical protein
MIYQEQCREREAVVYENYGPLTAAQGDMRIFAPIAYAAVRRAQIVPIVHVEALALAAWFPICWRVGAPLPTLIVLRTLCKDGSCQPPGSPRNASSLPLALRAYPFVAGAEGEDDTPAEILIDDVIPDQPTDVGAPILTAQGKAGKGTLMRLHAASAFNTALALTRSMTDELAAVDLLEPWTLEFDIAGQSIRVDDLLIVRPGDFHTPKIFHFIKKFGPQAASFLGAHRISLFRAGILVRAARALSSSQSNPSDAPQAESMR